MVSDISLLADDIRLELWMPTVSPPEFAFPGSQGVSSDCPAALCPLWGAKVFGTLSCVISAHTSQSLIADRRLSINPLELLASAGTVLLFDKGNCPVIYKFHFAETTLQFAMRPTRASPIVQWCVSHSASSFQSAEMRRYVASYFTSYKGKPHIRLGHPTTATQSREGPYMRVLGTKMALPGRHDTRMETSAISKCKYTPHLRYHWRGLFQHRGWNGRNWISRFTFVMKSTRLTVNPKFVVLLL